MANQTQSLFPETTPISLNNNHARVLKELMQIDRASQKQLIGKLGINKTSMSNIIKDLRALNWCDKEVSGPSKDVYTTKGREVDIDLFLARWHSLNQCILLRPHSIVLQGIIRHNETKLNKIIMAFSKIEGVKISPSYMQNNVEHTIYTEYGNIIFYSKSKLIKINIEGFVLPLKQEDIEYLEDYIREGISERFRNICGILDSVLKKYRIDITKSYCIKNIHLGLIAKKDIRKTMLMKQILKNHGLIGDKSIYGCDELEAKNGLEIAVANMKEFINSCNDANISFEFDCPAGKKLIAESKKHLLYWIEELCHD